MTDDRTPVEAAELHFELVACGALPEDSPIGLIEPRQIPNGNEPVWDARTNQEHDDEGVWRWIAWRRSGGPTRLAAKVGITLGRRWTQAFVLTRAAAFRPRVVDHLTSRAPPNPARQDGRMTTKDIIESNLQDASNQVSDGADIADEASVAAAVANVMAVTVRANQTLTALDPGTNIDDSVGVRLEELIKKLYEKLSAIIHASEGATFTIGVSTPVGVSVSVTFPRQPETA